jgi:preprotein translocase subunit SecE
VSDSAGTVGQSALGSPSRDGAGTDRPKRETGRSGGGRIRNIGTFYKQVVAELRKVIWPTRKELVTYTTVVVVFVLIITAIVAVFDLAFGKAVLAIFGQ